MAFNVSLQTKKFQLLKTPKKRFSLSTPKSYLNLNLLYELKFEKER